MAQITRTQAVTTTETGGYQPGNRLLGMPSGTASTEASAVQGISADVGVANQEINYRFGTAFQDQGAGRHAPERQPARMISRVMTSPDTFAAVLRANAGVEQKGERNGTAEGGRGFGGLLAKAIGTYETNARVVAGQNKFRGTVFSMAL
ncbi:MAG: hypothetical protein H7841_09270 [Magnetospirillum sp. WYHS-4]